MNDDQIKEVVSAVADKLIEGNYVAAGQIAASLSRPDLESCLVGTVYAYVNRINREVQVIDSIREAGTATYSAFSPEAHLLERILEILEEMATG